MPVVQPMLPLPRALPARTRAAQPYRLPNDVRDRLQAALRPFRNREAAYVLAVFLGRFWSTPGRLGLPFVIDRVALADREDLGLSEARIRGAIATLEKVGFLDRWPTSGSAYRPTAFGLRRKPVPFTFGSEYMPALLAANRRAKGAAGAVSRPARSQTPAHRPLPSTALPEARPYSPELKRAAELKVYLGDLPRLSLAALKAIGIAEAKRGGRRK